MDIIKIIILLYIRTYICEYWYKVVKLTMYTYQQHTNNSFLHLNHPGNLHNHHKHHNLWHSCQHMYIENHHYKGIEYYLIPKNIEHILLCINNINYFMYTIEFVIHVVYIFNKECCPILTDPYYELRTYLHIIILYNSLVNGQSFQALHHLLLHPTSIMK